MYDTENEPTKLTNDKRLNKRYDSLVQHFCQTATLSNSMKTPIDSIQTQSHTQALYRFLQNEKVGIAELSKPLLEQAFAATQQHCDKWVLVMHDWSMLHLAHRNKPQKWQRSHKSDVGYELQSSLLVSDKTGLPIAPIAQNLVCSEGTLSSYQAQMLPRQSHLDELGQRMNWLKQQGLSRPLLHIVDRDADSAAHLGQWQANEHHFLIRVKANNTLTYQGIAQKCAQIAEQLSYSKQKEHIVYKGQKAFLHIAQAPVILERAAKPKAQENGKRKAAQKGNPLSLNLICTQVQNQQGQVLAQWFLLTNTDIDMQQCVRFYYWRWQIESYFKLLKSSGFQMENWLQESALAFFKRALIVANSCILVWHLLHDTSDEAMDFKYLLVRLSGKNTKRKQSVVQITAPALLAGYLVLLSAHELLQLMSPDEIAQSVRLFKRKVV